MYKNDSNPFSYGASLRTFPFFAGVYYFLNPDGTTS